MPEIDTQPTVTPGAGATAGAKLRAAREAAGLSIDAVAHQLKLAPRQVTALEQDDWQRLPGRTFVRGFARNYARFVHLDPDAVLALLPGSDTAPALSRPALAASPRAMGEIPDERITKPSAARWLVPLLLLAIVGGIGYYELSRTTLHWPALFASLVGERKTAPPAASALPSPAQPADGGTSTAAAKPVDATAPAATMPVTPPTSPASSTPMPSASMPAGTGITVLPTPSADAASGNDASSAASSPSVATVPAAAAPATEAPLVLTFKGTSWAEVKDAKGRVVLQMTGGAGMTQTVSALPPLELALGNAPAVAVSFRGQSLDLTAYTRGSVARVSLQ